MQPERRLHRSNDPSRAIRIYLATHGDDPGLRAAVVSTEDGLLVGGVGGGDLDGLAALGSSMHQGTANVDRDCEALGFDRASIHTKPITVGGGTFVITSDGAPLAVADRVGDLLGRLLA